MPQDNNNIVAQNNDSEQFDLIDLILQLWRGKLLICAFIAIAIVIAGIYVTTAKQKWTSTAIITQPDAAQIGSYSNALNIVYGSSTTNANAAPKLADIQVGVFGRFSAALSALAGSLENQEIPEMLKLDPVIKTQVFPLQISYTSASAEAAQKKLALYIQKIDEQVAKELFIDLKGNIAQQIESLSNSLSNQEKLSQEQKDLRIRQIAEALQYAEAAKISSPQIQQTQDVTQDTLFLLGSEALQSMIERESTRPLVYSDDYYLNKQKLLDIEKLKIDPASIHAYRYVMKPDLPVRKDSPKKAIALILAVLLGGVVGAGVVLGRNALRNHKPKN
jgi:chain length determinant protein (polysaccharide antigen chain regulator)